MAKMTSEKIRLGQIIEIEKSKAALDQMYKEVGDRISEDRAKRVLHHDKKTNIVSRMFI